MLQTYEQYLLDAVYQDCLRAAQQSALVKIALESAPRRPSSVQILLARLKALLRKEVVSTQQGSRIIQNPLSAQKVG